MSTPRFHPEQAARDLAALTKKHMVGQDAAIEAFAAEVCRHIALSPLQRGPGVFLLAGPNIEDHHISMVAGLTTSLKGRGVLYSMAAIDGQDLAQILPSLSHGMDARPLAHILKHRPDTVFIFRDIDQARLSLLEKMKRAWSQGFVTGEGGEAIPLADSFFVLTTGVAQEQIGQIAREEQDPDRLHVTCLKALIDAGFPALIIKSIDGVFGLQHLDAAEVAHAHYRGLAEQVAAHGLLLEEGGIDARILLQAIDPTIEPHVPNLLLPRDNLDARLAQVKTAGAGTVRLVLDYEAIRILPVEKGTPQWVIDAFAAVDPVPSADGEAKDE
ncbi:hypothetical protein BB934_35480 (plasmid) [Microvirga ossetica]|uniref:Uncharacterized protein n=1 Tax=Microvirga ossetica TaxID=1882682 RepID=A0A1B2EUC3_9HYPH|nr:hypothetical protein [Microvirga ossetica]ANY83561.1 hypothetical protein BB934_35480 [Microvirga ossetica]